MASKAAIEKNNRRRRLAAKYATRRNELRAVASDMKRTYEERMEARAKLALLPRNSNPNRIRNRCNLTGRPRAYMRFFGLSRIAMRELAVAGELPGVRKSSL